MVFRLSLETGEVRQVTALSTMRPDVSPDGRFVAHYWMTPERWVMAVTPAEGGVPTAILPVAPTHSERFVRWAPDGRSLTFIDGVGGASNIWLQSTRPIVPTPAHALHQRIDGDFRLVERWVEARVAAGAGRESHRLGGAPGLTSADAFRRDVETPLASSRRGFQCFANAKIRLTTGIWHLPQSSQDLETME